MACFSRKSCREYIFLDSVLCRNALWNCFEDEFLPSFLCKPATQKTLQRSQMSPVMQFETTATQSLAKPVNGRQKENGITGSTLLISPFWFVCSEFYCISLCSNYLRGPLLEFIGRAEWVVFFFCNIKFLFRVYYSVVQSISFLFTGGGGGWSFFILTLCNNLFRNKSVCSIFLLKSVSSPSVKSQLVIFLKDFIGKANKNQLPGLKNFRGLSTNWRGKFAHPEHRKTWQY